MFRYHYLLVTLLLPSLALGQLTRQSPEEKVYMALDKAESVMKATTKPKERIDIFQKLDRSLKEFIEKGTDSERSAAIYYRSAFVYLQKNKFNKKTCKEARTNIISHGLGNSGKPFQSLQGPEVDALLFLSLLCFDNSLREPTTGW